MVTTAALKVRSAWRPVYMLRAFAHDAFEFRTSSFGRRPSERSRHPTSPLLQSSQHHAWRQRGCPTLLLPADWVSGYLRVGVETVWLGQYHVVHF